MLKVKAMYLRVMVMMTLLFTPGAFANESKGLVGVLKNIQELFQVGTQTLIYGFFAAGIFCFGVAGYTFYTVKDEQAGQNKGSWGLIACSCIAGAILCYVGAMAVAGGESMFGEANAAGSIDKTKFGL